MKQWGFVKIAFLWNLNFFNVTNDPATTDNAIYSLLTPGGMPRPAFEALDSGLDELFQSGCDHLERSGSHHGPLVSLFS